jgi:hypothetical protein
MGWLLFQMNLDILAHLGGGVFASPALVRTSLTSPAVTRTSTSDTGLTRTTVTSVGLDS